MIKETPQSEVTLTPAQLHLIKWLKVMKVEEDEMVGVMLLLQTALQREKMMEWLSQHHAATPSEILGKAMEISGQGVDYQ